MGEIPLNKYQTSSKHFKTESKPSVKPSVKPSEAKQPAAGTMKMFACFVSEQL